MRVVVLVPWRPGDGHRERLWRHVREWWAEHAPDWPVFTGGCDDGPFNRSQAVNRAAEAAGVWDVAVIVDADSFPGSVTQVVRAVETVSSVGGLVVAHTVRNMLNRRATDAVLSGCRDGLDRANWVEQVWHDSLSCCVAVDRATWDKVGGFDERFVGWGFEDSAFFLLCESAAGRPLKVEGANYHLWHPVSDEATEGHPLKAANRARLKMYEDRRGDLEAQLAVKEGAVWSAVDVPGAAPVGPIPRVLHRTVPSRRDPIVDRFWAVAANVCDGWTLRSWDEPLNPDDFPVTSPLWPLCGNGAQKAGLVRLELLWTHGGVYVDSDVELLRPFDPLLPVPMFAAWEDNSCVPDAVLGAAPGHPAVAEALNLAMRRVSDGADAWASGPGVTTEVLSGRGDVLLLPPGAFYPYHYLERSKARDNHAKTQPWAFCVHHWHGSWLTAEQRRSLEQRQR